MTEKLCGLEDNSNIHEVMGMKIHRKEKADYYVKYECGCTEEKRTNSIKKIPTIQEMIGMQCPSCNKPVVELVRKIEKREITR